jgi:sulfonate transport system substrate-binding protein
VDVAVERIVAARGNYEVLPITPAVVKQQQAIADDFVKLGLLPHHVDVAANVWTAPATVGVLSVRK